MDSWLRSECTCKSTSSPLTSSCKPQNRYLCYLLDEFEKCSQQSGDLTKLQKEHQIMKKEIAETQRDVRDLKFEKQLMSEKVASLQREMQEQKLLHSQLRDEASSEFRSLYRKSGNQEKDVDLLKYQLKMSNKKFALDLENMRWELTTNRKLYNSTFNDSETIDDQDSKDKM